MRRAAAPALPPRWEGTPVRARARLRRNGCVQGIQGRPPPASREAPRPGGAPRGLVRERGRPGRWPRPSPSRRAARRTLRAPGPGRRSRCRPGCREHRCGAAVPLAATLRRRAREPGAVLAAHGRAGGRRGVGRASREGGHGPRVRGRPRRRRSLPREDDPHAAVGVARTGVGSRGNEGTVPALGHGVRRRLRAGGRLRPHRVGRQRAATSHRSEGRGSRPRGGWGAAHAGGRGGARRDRRPGGLPVRRSRHHPPRRRRWRRRRRRLRLGRHARDAERERGHTERRSDGAATAAGRGGSGHCIVTVGAL